MRLRPADGRRGGAGRRAVDSAAQATGGDRQESAPRRCRLSEVRDGWRAQCWREARRSGWEGHHGQARRRALPTPACAARDWLKLKIEQRQEFVVGGYTEPRNSRAHFGALAARLLRRRRASCTPATPAAGSRGDCSRTCTRRLAPLATETESVRDDTRRPTRSAHWVTPESWSRVKVQRVDRRRAPCGSRSSSACGTTRRPREVVREATSECSGGGSEASQQEEGGKARRRAATRAGKSSATKCGRSLAREEARAAGKRAAKSASRSRRSAPVRRGARAARQRSRSEGGKGTLELDTGTLDVTNLGKVFYPGVGAHQGRPDSLLREASRRISPAGDRGPTAGAAPLPERHRGQGVLPAEGAGRSAAVGAGRDGAGRRDRDAEPADRRRPRDPALHRAARRGLGGPVALAGGEHRVSRTTRSSTSTRGRRRRSSAWSRSRCGSRRCSTSSGLPPVRRRPARVACTSCCPLARACRTTARAWWPSWWRPLSPIGIRKRRPITRAVKARSASSVYVDYLQNIRGKTVAGVYSARANEGATVSMPLDWKEVEAGAEAVELHDRQHRGAAQESRRPLGQRYEEAERPREAGGQVIFTFPADLNDPEAVAGRAGRSRRVPRRDRERDRPPRARGGSRPARGLHGDAPSARGSRGARDVRGAVVGRLQGADPVSALPLPHAAAGGGGGALRRSAARTGPWSRRRLAGPILRRRI